MTKEEIKNRILNDDGYLDSIAELLSDIMADEAAKEPEEFLPHEIVYWPVLTDYHVYETCWRKKDPTIQHISINELVHTIAARMPEVTSVRLSETGNMQFDDVGGFELGWLKTNITGEEKEWQIR